MIHNRTSNSFISEWIGYHEEGKGLDNCYSAVYTSQTHDQQHFTISEVAADWHEPVVLQFIMSLSIARTNEKLDPQCS